MTARIMIYDFHCAITDLILVRFVVSDLELNPVTYFIIPDIQSGIRLLLRFTVTICKSPSFRNSIYPDKALISDRISIAISREIQ